MCLSGACLNIFALCICLHSPVLINEVHYDPDGTDTGFEFVELMNTGAEAVPLSGYELQSGNGASPDDWTTEWSGDMVSVLDPDHLYVIGESKVIPEPDEVTALDLQNGPDAVRLIYFGEVVDAVGWGEHSFPEYYEGNPAADVSSGLSVVRNPDGYDTGDNSVDFAARLPSPGSFSSHMTDLTVELDTVGFSGNLPMGQASLIPFMITNSGRKACAGDAAMSLGERGQTLATSTLEIMLAPRESTESGFSWLPENERFLLLSLTVAFSGDQDTTNNAAEFIVRAGNPAPAIVINEIMANPTEGPEWVELISLFGVPVAIDRWTLGDGVEQHALNSANTIAPGGYVIVCKDTSGFGDAGCHVTETDGWETLSRDDTVVLRSGLGVTLDSVSYVASWGAETDMSLERVRPDLPSTRENWGTCQDESGGTQCSQNSIYLDAALASGRIMAEPNPFEADGSSRLLISYTFPFMKAYSQVRIFDRTGVVVRTLCNGKRLYGKSSELWDGTDDSGELLPTGIYIVLAEATSEQGETASAKLPVAVVRRKR